MSKVIKSSRIIGEYKLNDLEVKNENMEKDGQRKADQVDKSSSSTTENDGEQKKNEEKIEAQKEAEEIIARAEQKAAEIKDEARQQIENELEEARTQGYEEGYEKGFEEGKEKGYEDGYKDGIKEFRRSAETLAETVEKVRKEFAEEKQRLPGKVVDLSIRIAARIINTELDVKPELINNIIEDMLSSISNNHTEIKIKVIPELIEYIDEVEIESFLGEKNVKFIGDSSLEKGDCIVKTDFGGKDGTLTHKLELLEKELYKGIGSNGET